MFKRIKKLFSPKGSSGHAVIERSTHNFNDKLISPSAIKVINKLQQSGYPAYLVGGGIRDILLGGQPKDFDVATSATPEEIRGLFRNSKIIGRRFRIVHVRFGREIIEVTTFRAHHDEAKDRKDADQSHTGMLLRDNVYGDIESDAIRRDFTVNALYYDPTSGQLLDYTHALDDLEARELNIIGDAEARYREDPVRMLRAVRFSAKLGFQIADSSARPIYRMAPLLKGVSPARLFDEVLKLVMNGAAANTLIQLREFGLFEQLFPMTEAFLKNDPFADKMIHLAAQNTDKRILSGKRVTPAFIYAVFLWPAIRDRMSELQETERLAPQEALQKAAQGIVGVQLGATSIPKRFLIPMREIWALQLRLPKRDGQRAFVTLEHPRFRAAYDFLLLREEAGEDLNDLGRWWTQFQDADSDTQQRMASEVASPQKRRRRPRRRRPNNKPQSDS